MFGMVVKNYLENFKWSNIKEANVGIRILMFWYVLIIPLVLSATKTEGIFGEEYIRFILWWIPFWLGMISIGLVNPRLSKIYYICPMSSTQRCQYLLMLFWLTVLIPIIIEILGVFVMMCLPTKTTFYLYYVVLVLSMFSTQLSICICPEISAGIRTDEFKNWQKKKFKLETNKGIKAISIIVFTLGIFVGALLSIGWEELDFTDMHISYKVFIVVSCIVMTVLDVRLCVYVKTALQKYATYE